MHERRVRVERALVVDERVGRFDVDDDRVDRVLGAVARVGDDHGDRLADAAHVAVGEQRNGR